MSNSNVFKFDSLSGNNQKGSSRAYLFGSTVDLHVFYKLMFAFFSFCYLLYMQSEKTEAINNHFLSYKMKNSPQKRKMIQLSFVKRYSRFEKHRWPNHLCGNEITTKEQSIIFPQLGTRRVPACFLFMRRGRVCTREEFISDRGRSFTKTGAQLRKKN